MSSGKEHDALGLPVTKTTRLEEEQAPVEEKPQGLDFRFFSPAAKVEAPAPAKPREVQAGPDVGAEYTVVDLLKETVRKKASDLHLAAGAPPHLRVDGELHPMALPRLVPREIKGLVYSMMHEKQIKDFEMDKEFDFSYSIKNFGRFRVNVFKQRDSVGCVIRAVPTMKLSIEELGLPPVTKDLVMRPRGIIIVTGPTGSGKTTSLAAMIDYINNHRHSHIMTIEDPIEFLHKHKKCLVNQRELGQDTESYAKALRHVLRQDPDVIFVGELRDLESMQTAITAAETGHLVFGTLHTTGAEGTVNRIVDVFPTEQQEQIRTQLSVAIIAVLSQALLPRIPKGLVAAYELMVVTAAIANLIRENKTYRINSSIQTGRKFGMQLLDESLFDLFVRGLVEEESVILKAQKANELRERIKRYQAGLPTDEEGEEAEAEAEAEAVAEE